jgi:hypothetical protein
MTKETEKPYQHDDANDVARAKANAKAKATKEQNELAYLMGLPEFRSFVWWVLEQTHIYKTSFTGNSETFFREGERNIGLKVFSRVQEASPESYAAMVKENMNTKEVK